GSFAVEMRPAFPGDPDYPDRAAAVLSGSGIPAGRAAGFAAAVAAVLSRKPEGKELLEAAIADAVYRQPSNRLLEARTRQAGGAVPGSTFSYLFTWRSPAMGGKLGACHALDIPFVFRQLDALAAAFLTRGRAPQSLSDAMGNAWGSFARTGTPDTATLAWPPYGAERTTMILDAEPRLEDDPRREIREFFAAVSPLPAR
ncbi:MAG TPA: carboxylesterase family protein, partial [Arthrobacter sp.]